MLSQVGADPDMRVTATVEVDQTQLNRLFLNLVRIGEKHGVRFPREFGLFLKQVWMCVGVGVDGCGPA